MPKSLLWKPQLKKVSFLIYEQAFQDTVVNRTYHFKYETQTVETLTFTSFLRPGIILNLIDNEELGLKIL